ncbi:hypothetical protein JHK85_001742 [Glycine max]|nr:hypothetical protein JHK85_001742 [Glycine max]KAG5089089.1 hypothetical protein JHK86_001701 [Glycine max]
MRETLRIVVEASDFDSSIIESKSVQWWARSGVGGWTQGYGNILSFATVRGASHEAPFSQPKRSLMLFKSFLEGID